MGKTPHPNPQPPTPNPQPPPKNFFSRPYLINAEIRGGNDKNTIKIA
jgi:hypothetical protein